MKILVTGFEPFGGQTVNSSASAVALLPQTLGGHTIDTLILPVAYTRSDKLLLERIRATSPDAVVCVGQNAGSADVRVESTAGNYAHSEAEDNDHNLWLYRSRPSLEIFMRPASLQRYRTRQARSCATA